MMETDHKLERVEETEYKLIVAWLEDWQLIIDP